MKKCDYKERSHSKVTFMDLNDIAQKLPPKEVRIIILCANIIECIQEFTLYMPRFIFKPGVSCIWLIWREQVPNAEITPQLVEALKKFGSVYETYQSNCTTFIITF